MTPSPICFVDTETTDLHPVRRRVWEVGIIRREPGGRHTEWQAFVDVDLSDGNEFALGVGRFYERHPLGRDLSGREPLYDERGPNFLAAGAAALQVARMTHGAHIVGAVPDFDTRSLGDLIRGHGLIPAWHYHILCAETLALGYLAGRGKVFDLPFSSDDLTAALGLDPVPDGERHTALGDARFAMRMWDAVMSGGDR